MKSQKYYVVWQGRKTGIFTSWQECERQIKGFNNSKYKSFKTRQEAEEAFGIIKHSSFLDTKDEHNLIINKQYRSNGIITNSICVDASCLGNPGDLEYRGVHTLTKEVIFHKSAMAY